MKPIRLTIEAFGAFHQAQTIDFDSFNEYGLFLIHGPTGAGKTTIFDAMCLALFGKTTSGRHENAMRSQYASANEPTKVELVFKAKQQYYKVERCFTPNRNGDEINKKSTFCEVFPFGFIETGNPITKETEITNKVRKILGFDADQFKQIVILPQGKFSEFLRAKTKEKEEILTQLFGITFYDQITKLLKKQADELAKGRADLENQRQAQLANLGVADEIALAEKIGSLAVEIEGLRSNSEDLVHAEQRVNQAHQQAQTLAGQFEEHDQIKHKRHSRSQQENAQLTKLLKLKYAEQAALLHSNFEQAKQQQIGLEKKGGELKKAQVGEQETNQILAQKKQEFNNSQPTHDEQIKTYTDRLNDLQNALPQFDEIEQLVEELRRIETTLTSKEKQWTATLAQQLDGEKRLEANQKRIGELEPKAQNLAVLELQLPQLKEVGGQLKKRDISARAVDKARQDQTNAFSALNIANQHREQTGANYNETEHMWIVGQAASLSVKLEPDLPCPVCGSTHHPRKASAANLISDETLQQSKAQKIGADKNYDSVNLAYNNIRIACTETETAHQSLVNQLGEYAQKPLAEFAQAYKTLEVQVQAAQQAQTELDQLRPANQQLKDQSEYNKVELGKLETDLASLKATKTEKAENLTKKQQKLPAKCEDRTKAQANIKKGNELLEAANTKRKQAGNEIQDLEIKSAKLASDCQNLANQFQEVQENQRELLTNNLAAAIAQGFKDVAAAQQAFLPEYERRQLDAEIQQWRDESTRLDTEHNRLKRLIGEQLKPDLAQFKAQYDQAVEANRANIAQVAQKQTTLAEAQRQADQLAGLATTLAQLRTEEAPFAELASLTNGENRQKMTLATYVISTLLDEVLVHTNQRLSAMSSGRFEIGRIVELVSGNGKKGLEMEVFDAYTGKKREVNNLSGGETFFTSLALALGLADVASSRQGGVRVEALFIDEGFGTLDNETLDLAIGTLTELEAQHRLVGIISHVGELRERIPARLEVRKGNQGSQISVYLPK